MSYAARAAFSDTVPRTASRLVSVVALSTAYAVDATNRVTSSVAVPPARTKRSRPVRRPISRPRGPRRRRGGRPGRRHLSATSGSWVSTMTDGLAGAVPPSTSRSTSPPVPPGSRARRWARRPGARPDGRRAPAPRRPAAARHRRARPKSTTGRGRPRPSPPSRECDPGPGGARPAISASTRGSSTLPCDGEVLERRLNRWKTMPNVRGATETGTRRLRYMAADVRAGDRDRAGGSACRGRRGGAAGWTYPSRTGPSRRPWSTPRPRRSPRPARSRWRGPDRAPWSAPRPEPPSSDGASRRSPRHACARSTELSG